MQWASVDLYDKFEDSVATCSAQFRSFGAVARFCGPIETVSCFEDNSLVRKALEEQGEGRVLVVDGKGSMRCALLGDMIAAMAARNNWAGIMINAAVRDCEELANINIGIFALGTNPAKSRKQGAGQSGVRLVFGDAVFEPGSWVYCDADGVLIAPRKL